MKTTTTMHLEGAPNLSVDCYEGSYWLRLQDASTDHVAIFCDVPMDVLSRAVDAFTAALAAPADEHKEAAE